MNGSKPLRLLGGRTLLARTLDYARQLGFPVALSLRSQVQIPSITELTVIEDRPDIEGPLGGVIAGLAWANSKDFNAVLAIPIDMPWLPEDLACRLIEEANGKPSFACSADKAHPICALWPVSKLDDAESYATTGRRSLRGLLEILEARKVEWPVGHHDPFANLNDPIALAEAERQLRKSR
jgi:molybdopterin-guanine dinucleotide biosynthesis protein A